MLKSLLFLAPAGTAELHPAWRRTGGGSDPRGQGHLQEGGEGGGRPGEGRGLRGGGREVSQQAVRLPVHHHPLFTSASSYFPESTILL